MKDLYRVAEAAEVLGVSRWTVTRLLNSGDLGHVMWSASGRKYRYIPHRELERYRSELSKGIKRRKRRQ